MLPNQHRSQETIFLLFVTRGLVINPCFKELLNDPYCEFYTGIECAILSLALWGNVTVMVCKSGEIVLQSTFGIVIGRENVTYTVLPLDEEDLEAMDIGNTDLLCKCYHFSFPKKVCFLHFLTWIIAGQRCAGVSLELKKRATVSAKILLKCTYCILLVVKAVWN